MAEIGTNSAATSTSFAGTMHALRESLYGTLFIMQKKHTNSPLLAVSSMVIQWLQILSFLFVNPLLTWDAPSIAPIKILSMLFIPAGWVAVSTTTVYQVLFFASLAFVALFVGNLLFSMKSFMKGGIPDMWPLRVLAEMGAFAVTVGYLPVLMLLLSVFNCSSEGTGKTWVGAGYYCYTGSHLALCLIAGVFALIFICMASVFALVFYDPHPLSSNTAGKVHGRVEFGMLLVKAILILAIDTFGNSLGGPWAVAGINIAAALSWTVATFLYMPYTHHIMNALQLALSALYLWGGVSLVIETASPVGVNAAIVFYVGIPTAAIIGVGLATIRRRTLTTLSVSKMISPYEVELRARYMLQDAMNAVLSAATKLAAKLEESASAGADPETGDLASPRDVVMKGDDGTASIAGGASKPGSVAHTRDAKSRRSAADGTNDMALLAAAYAAADAEARAGLIRVKLSSKLIAEAEALYKSAVLRYPTSAVLHVFQAKFYSTYKDDRQLNTSHLLLANRLSPSLDVAFQAFQARRMGENGVGSGVLSSSMHRVSFDKHLAEAKLSTTKAAQAQVAFWSELSDPKPDISQLHKIATDMADHTQWADDHFKEVFALHPQSLSAMRLFAQYNLTVANNPEKATAISAEADRIEDQRNKEQLSGTGLGSHFTFMNQVPPEMASDALAVLTVGATSRDLGIILSANAAVCKILGYTRLQLERRNISVIVPAPYSEIHESFMRRYLSTGEGKMVENAVTALAKHRQGHLIPVIVYIREVQLADGTAVFQGTLRPMSFTDHLVMMDEDWVIQGGTAGALMALGVEPATLSASEVCMADYCPTLLEPASVDELAAKPSGGIISMQLPSSDPPAIDAAGSSFGGCPVSPFARVGGAGGAGAGGKTMTTTVDVKATFSTTVKKGFTINILTWHSLTQSEINQAANTAAGRRASIMKGEKSSVTNKGGYGGPGLYSTNLSLQRGVSFRDEAAVALYNHDSRSDGDMASARQAAGDSTAECDDGRDRLGSGRSGASSHGRNSNRSRDTASDAAQDDDNDSLDSDAVPTNTGSFAVPSGHRRIQLSAAAFTGASCPVVGKGAKPSAQPTQAVKGKATGPSRPVKGGMNGLGGPGEPQHKGNDGKDYGVGVHAARGPAPGANGSLDGSDTGPHPQASGLTGRSDVDSTSQRNGSVAGGKSVGSASVDDKKPFATAARRGSAASVGDGERSVGQSSHGSSSKRSGVSKATMNKLRRILNDGKVSSSVKALPGLFSLYVTGWLLFLTNFALGVLTAALLDGNFGLYANNLQFASVAGRTSEYQVRALRLIMQRVMFNRGWMESTEDEEQRFSVEMYKMAEQFAQKTQAMYGLVVGTDREAYFKDADCEYVDFADAVPEPPGRVSNNAMKAMLLGNVYWPTSLMDGSVEVGRRRKTSLLDFSSQWAGMLKQLSQMPTENVTLDSDIAQFLIINTQTGAPAHLKIKQAVYESYLASRDSEDVVSLLVLWIFVAMGPVLSVAILILVIPILLFIDRSRDDIMERFLDLPNLVIATLRAQAEKRLKTLRSEEDGDDSDEEEEDDELARRLGINHEEGDESEGESINGNMDWESIFQRAAVEQARADKKTIALLNGHVAGRSSTTDAAVVTIGAATTSTTNNGNTAAARAGKRQPAASTCCGLRKAQTGPVLYPNRTMCSRGKRAPGGGYYRSVVNPDGTVTSFIRRDFRKNSKGICSLTVFLLPVLLMFIFYLVLYLVTMDTLKSVINMSAFTALASLRAASLESTIGSVYFMIARSGYPPEEAFRFDWTNQELINVRELNQLLSFEQHIIVRPWLDGGVKASREYERPRGGETSSIPGIPAEKMKAIAEAMTGDACPFIATYTPSGNTGKRIDAECAAFNGAVYTSGLQSGFRDFVSRVRRLKDRRWAAEILPNSTDGTGMFETRSFMDWATEIDGITVDGSDNGIGYSPPGGTYVTNVPPPGPDEPRIPVGGANQAAGQTTVTLTAPSESEVTWGPYSIPGELLSDDFRMADASAATYLSPAFMTIAEWYSQVGEQMVKSYRLFLLAYTAAFLALFSAGIFMLYLPAIGTLGRDIQTKRAMLLMLPTQVSAKVPSIRALVIQIVAEQEGGGNNNQNRQYKQDEGEQQQGEDPAAQNTANPLAATAGTVSTPAAAR